MATSTFSFRLRIRKSLVRLLKPERRKNPLLFFETPRAASGSIHVLCRECGVGTYTHDRRGNHPLLRDRIDLLERFVFAVVRNPFDRFISCYKWLSLGGENEDDAEDKKKFIRDEEDVNQFAERWVYPGSELLTQTHFTPMFVFLTTAEGKLIPRVVFKYEDLDGVDGFALFNLIGARSGSQLPKMHSTSSVKNGAFRENDVSHTRSIPKGF